MGIDRLYNSIRVLIICFVIIAIQRTGHAQQRANPQSSSSSSGQTAKPTNRSRAIDLIDFADVARAEWEKLSVQEKRSTAGKLAREEVEKSYQEIIDLTPKSNIASYALFNIMGMHKSSRDLIETKKIYARILIDYSGAQQEIDAHMSMGLTYLQSLKKPSEALKYFEKIRNPRGENYDLIQTGGALGNDSGSLNQESIAYVRARLQMIRSYLALGEIDESASETQTLIAQYPEAKDWVSNRVGVYQSEELDIPAQSQVDNESVKDITSDTQAEIELMGQTEESTSSVQSLSSRGNAPRTRDLEVGRLSAGRDILAGAGIAELSVPQKRSSRRILTSLLLVFTITCLTSAAVLEYFRRMQA